MIFILLFLISIIIILIYKLIFSLNKNFAFSLTITMLCSLFIVEIIINPQICIQASINGAKLFFYKVFPSLYTFMVICNILVSYNGIEIYSNTLGKFLCFPLKLPRQCSFALIVSMLCGYPLGAKYSIELYEKGIIDLFTCQRLLSIATNISPLFAIGAIGTSMLHNTYLGYILIISSYISCFIIGLLLPIKAINKNNLKFSSKSEFKTNNLGEVLKKSIENSLKTCLSIAGFIILFSVIISLLNNTLFIYIKNNSIKGTLLGMIELTKGCSLISSSTLTIKYKLIIISFLLSFSGLSIISQVYSFVYKYKISMSKYISLKFIQGILSSIIVLVIYDIFFKYDFFISTFNNATTFNTKTPIKIITLIIFFILFPMFLNKLKKLFNTF